MDKSRNPGGCVCACNIRPAHRLGPISDKQDLLDQERENRWFYETVLGSPLSPPPQWDFLKPDSY
ncbi:MAG: hypothetical protein KAW12_06390 [Candidatus Aminicenantes bacterium]|nr:hypothetical protein [Candidatus Aminicenantes bacterium]